MSINVILFSIKNVLIFNIEGGFRRKIGTNLKRLKLKVLSIFFQNSWEKQKNSLGKKKNLNAKLVFDKSTLFYYDLTKKQKAVYIFVVLTIC